jgi:AraC-binding-like domain
LPTTGTSRSAETALFFDFLGTLTELTPVDRIFSTDGLHPRDRFDYWHEVASERIIGHRSRPKNRSTFEAQLHAGTLADIGLLLVKNSPMHAVRTHRHIARVAGDDLLVCLQIAGKVVFEQDGREAVLQENAFCLIDPLRTSSVKFFDGSKMLVLKLARPSVEARVGKTHDMTARSISREGSIGSLTASFLTLLPTQ